MKAASGKYLPRGKDFKAGLPEVDRLTASECGSDVVEVNQIELKIKDVWPRLG